MTARAEKLHDAETAFVPEGPQPILRPIPPGEAYPVADLGPLRAAVEAVQDMVQAPVAIAAQSALAVVSLAVQGFADVETLGGAAPCSLFGLTIAESGERKSSCDRLLMQGIRDHEAGAALAYRADLASWLTSCELWEARRKRLVSDAAGKDRAKAIAAEADLRALPNASFIGFTGTPIEQDDVNTPAVFGHYIDVYDISRAVEDGATVPIYYESRLARIELPEDEKPKIDAEIEELTEDEAVSEQERLKRKWSTVEALVGAEKRLHMVAEDLVAHFEARVQAMDGKAMVVCMSRRICVDLYNQIIALRPEWHSDDDNAGLVKIVMTGSASDPEAWQPHIGSKARRDLLAKRAKDPKDPLKLVIVRDMWLTGFDSPSMHTMYIDKPMRGHGLMQAIARVNRVFRDKPAGLIVDYIGIAQNLKSALGQYSKADQAQAGIDEAEAISAMLERLDVVRAMFHGFDYSDGLTGTPHQRLTTLAEALNLILARQDEAAQRETGKEAKKAAHRRYQDAVLALSKAFALCSASDAARDVRDEVGFFQTVRAAMVKAADPPGRSAEERELAIRQIVNGAVVSTEIVDILSAAGLSSPDISILSDDFLAEIAQTERKNLALEALRKLLNDEIRSRSRSNVVETRKFSDRLEDAIARYHTNAVSTVEVLQELIALAKDMRAPSVRKCTGSFRAEG